MIVRAARSTIVRSVPASISSWVVRPAAVDPVDAEEEHAEVHPARVCSASGPISS